MMLCNFFILNMHNYYINIIILFKKDFRNQIKIKKWADFRKKTLFLFLVETRNSATPILDFFSSSQRRGKMEMSFTYTPSPSPQRLMRFDHGVLSSQFPLFTPRKHSHGGNSSLNGLRTPKSAPLVKASLSSSSMRRTLSSNWDVLENFSATSAPSLARFEELDTTNMLLRQRIIFLGSQVVSLSLSVKQDSDSWFLDQLCWIFLQLS